MSKALRLFGTVVLFAIAGLVGTFCNIALWRPFREGPPLDNSLAVGLSSIYGSLPAQVAKLILSEFVLGLVFVSTGIVARRLGLVKKVALGRMSSVLTGIALLPVSHLVFVLGIYLVSYPLILLERVGRPISFPDLSQPAAGILVATVLLYGYGAVKTSFLAWGVKLAVGYWPPKPWAWAFLCVALIPILLLASVPLLETYGYMERLVCVDGPMLGILLGFWVFRADDRS